MGKEYKAPERTIDDIGLLEPEATYSYADYLRWSFEERVELIKGKIFRMSPAPNVKHQKVSMHLSREISQFLLNRTCQVFAAPFDVRFPTNKNAPNNQVFTIVQPDLCVICNPEKLDDAGCNGAPDLIVEILSPSTSKKDLVNKYKLYEEHKVKEYWIVYPGEEVVEIFVLEETGKYATGRKYVAQDAVDSKVLSGFSLRLDAIFQGLTSK